MSLRSGARMQPVATNDYAVPPGTLGMGPGAIGGPKNKEPKKGTAVITIDELERIKAQCTLTQDTSYQQMKTQQAKALQGTSKGRVKNWPNTLEAQRVRREEERIRRLEDEEIERRRVDAEEADYQEGLRHAVISKANKHMHEAQDQVKSLKSKMMLCDVAHEQEAQKKLMGRKKQIGKDIEFQFNEMEKAQMAEYDCKMQAKLELEYKNKIENAKSISNQLEEFKLKYIQNLKAEMLEGELIKRQAEEDLEREKGRELARQKRAMQMKQELIEANKQQMRMQEEAKQAELAEEERIEQFAKKKAARDLMKQEREHSRFSEKQNERQRMIDRQIEQLRGIRDNEAHVLDKQVQEAEDKANRLFEEQERRKLEMKLAIERSRQLQCARHLKEKENGKQEEKEFAQFWRTRNEELQLAEQQEKEEERVRAQELANFHKNQTQRKNDEHVSQFKKDQDSALRAQALLDQQEKNFYSYAEQCIKEWQGQGKNVKPLIMELKNYKKQTI